MKRSKLGGTSWRKQRARPAAAPKVSHWLALSVFFPVAKASLPGDSLFLFPGPGSADMPFIFREKLKFFLHRGIFSSVQGISSRWFPVSSSRFGNAPGSDDMLFILREKLKLFVQRAIFCSVQGISSMWFLFLLPDPLCLYRLGFLNLRKVGFTLKSAKWVLISFHFFTISTANFSQVIGLQSKDEALFSVTAWKSTLLIQGVIYLSPEYCHGPCSLINRDLLTISFYMDQSPRKFLEPVDIRGGPCHCTFTNAGCNYYQEAGMPFCVHCMPSNWYNSWCSCPCRACDLSDTDWSGTDENNYIQRKHGSYTGGGPWSLLCRFFVTAFPKAWKRQDLNKNMDNDIE